MPMFNKQWVRGHKKDCMCEGLIVECARSTITPQEEWEPEMGEKYYYLSLDKVNTGFYANDRIDKKRKSFLGIYKSKEACQTAIDEIKRKLGK